MTGYLPTLEPDFDVKQELRFIDGVLDLRQFDKIFISVSGGKDSHAMMFLVKELAEKQGCSEKLIAMYADTGMEWYNAEEHVKRICSAAGVQMQVVTPIRTLIEQMKWQIDYHGDTVGFPTPHCRYCTRRQKIEPLDSFCRKYSGKLLKVTGERWQESKTRSTYAEFVKVERLGTKERTVYGWRPMLAYSTADVFQMVKDSGVERHICYDLGCERLGCAGCIFSSDRELKIEMDNNPLIFEALDKLETDSGYAMSRTGKKIRERIK